MPPAPMNEPLMESSSWQIRRNAYGQSNKDFKLQWPVRANAVIVHVHAHVGIMIIDSGKWESLAKSVADLAEAWCVAFYSFLIYNYMRRYIAIARGSRSGARDAFIEVRVQRTGVDKNMGLGGRPPYHLKSAQGRGRHHLKWPFSFFLFMGLVGYSHPLNPFIWPQCASFVALVLVSRREETREVYRNLAAVLAVYSVDQE